MGRSARPIDISLGTLPRELEPLIEALAKAQGIGQEGTSQSGPENLRASLIATVERILSLGYRIEPPVEEALSSDFPSTCMSVPQLLERLRSRTELKLSDLLPIQNVLLASHWVGPPEVYELLGSRILKAGEPILAYDVLTKGLQFSPTSIRLKQLLALALARSGATTRANLILRGLYEKGHTDGETLGVLARTHKDLAEQAADASERKQQLREAQAIYDEAYRLALEAKRIDDAIYTGINAATTALLMGNAQKARKVAGTVRNLCHTKLGEEQNYWALATLGEVAIILGEWNEAEERYGRAAESGRGRFGDLSSTRRQARLLMDFLGTDTHRFDHCFTIPTVLVFSSHLQDHIGRSHPSLPECLEDALRQKIAGSVGRFREKIGYCGVAYGSDLLFLEEMVRQKGEINIVLPFPRDDFEKAIVDIVPDAWWQKRVRAVLEKATNLVAINMHRVAASQLIHDYSNLMQNGLAKLRAQMLDTEVLPLVVLDGRYEDGPSGGTRLVAQWRAQGLIPEVVDIAKLAEESLLVLRTPNHDVHVSPDQTPTITAAPEFPQQIAALLVADVAGYSKLEEDQFPRFLKHFLGSVAELLTHLPRGPLVKNTWGDALYFVFSRVADAGRFALELQDRLCGGTREAENSAEALNLRIALHAGPIFTWTDPVTDQLSATGWHVVRAARIEPVTPPGQVYASQAFAAVAAAEDVKEFTCDYVGEIPMAKGFGAYPTYHVRHRHE
jgi:class 3 adenylate cyclase/tetratricopeptide (TPR) repeat protein